MKNSRLIFRTVTSNSSEVTLFKCFNCRSLSTRAPWTGATSSKSKEEKEIEAVINSTFKQLQFPPSYKADFKKHFLEGFKSASLSSAKDASNERPWGDVFKFFVSVWVGGVISYVIYQLYNNIEVHITNFSGSQGPANSNLVHPKEIPKVKFSDVKGCDEVKIELEEYVSYLKNPGRIAKLGGRMPKGLLMIGPPGVGKTLLAKAMAGEATVPFYYANGSEFDGMFVGSGAQRIRTLYKEARKNTPCIVFLDEIDSIAPMRLFNSNNGSSYTSRDTIDQLLAELDGFKSNEGVLTIGATNFPQSLDVALTRPGRFDSKVRVDYPTLKGRKEILNLYLSKIKLSEVIDREKLSRNLIGFTGADIQNIVNQAAIEAARLQQKGVTQKELDHALDRARRGREQKHKKYTPETINVLTANQAGLALVGLLLGRDVHRCTILPVGSNWGATTLVPLKKQSITDSRDSIVFLLAGRAAENILIADSSSVLSTYSAESLNAASVKARELIMNFGYSPKVGVIAGQKEVSRELHNLVDEEAERIVTECYSEAVNLLKNHKAELIKLREALRSQESLNGKQIEAIIGLKRPEDTSSTKTKVHISKDKILKNEAP